MGVVFGRPARALWSLDDDGVFLNHGSYGACPLVVQDEQARIRGEMEARPDDFFHTNILPREEPTPLRAVADALGALTGAPGGQVALVENATVGIQAVLQSVSLAPGDEILLTDHQYNAVRLAVDVRCRETGAIPRIARIPLPTSAEAVRARIAEAVTPQVKLAIIDHITSATALVLPIKEVVADMHDRGVRVLVDGAHAIGQIPVDIADVGADWYVTNAHKWLFAPKGSALLYAAAPVAAMTRPPIISHFIDMGFPRAFDYLGTRDYSAWLAIPAAMRFFEDLGPDAVRAYNSRLLAFGADRLMALGARPVGPLGMCASMRSFILPQRRVASEADAMDLKRGLWETARIQVNAAAMDGALLIRISAQVYVEAADFAALADHLDRNGWPGR